MTSKFVYVWERGEPSTFPPPKKEEFPNSNECPMSVLCTIVPVLGTVMGENRVSSPEIITEKKGLYPEPDQ